MFGPVLRKSIHMKNLSPSISSFVPARKIIKKIFFPLLAVLFFFSSSLSTIARPIAGPTISATGILSGLSSTYGSASASTSVSISGANMTAGISVTAPAGFEVSTNNTAFSGTLTVGAAGTIVSTKVYVRLAAANPAGAYSGNVNLSSQGAASVSEATMSGTVAKAALTITANNQTTNYGQALPSLTISYSGFTNGDNAASLTNAPDIGSSGTSSSPAGTYPITASGAVGPNYNISYVAGTLSVSKVPLTVTADNQAINLGQAIPILTATYNGFVNGDNTASLTTAASVSTTATSSSPVGSYPIKANSAIDPNYIIGYVAGTLKINPALPVLTISANNQSTVYGQTIPPLTVTYTGFVNGDNAASLTTAPAVSATGASSSPAGAYPITASGAADPNYALKYVAGTLTIGKAPLTVTADNQTIKHSQAIPILTATYSGFVNGDNAASLTTAASVSTPATSSSPLGSYPITASGAIDPNYIIGYVAGTLNIVGPPAVSYTGPQTYTAGTAIASLAPVSSGVAAPNYNNAPVTLGFGFNSPDAVAVDIAGNVYVADANNNAIKKIPLGGVPVTIGGTVSNARGVAVDAAGNVYASSYTSGNIYKIPVGGGAMVTIATGLVSPGGLAVDGAGNVYIAATGNGGVKMIPAAGGTPVFLSFGFNSPTAVAVDAAGNVYVADSGENAIFEIPVNGGQRIQLAAFTDPTGVAVDAAGNVYASNHGANALYQVPAGGGTPVLVSDAFSSPMGIAVDGAGKVYVADASTTSIDKIIPSGGYYISPALPAGLNFNESTGVISGTPTVGSLARTYTVTAYSSSDSSSATLSIQVNLPSVPTLSYSSPHVYTALSAITALAPTGSGIAAPSYSRSTVTIGSGFVNPYDVAVDAAGNLFIVQQSSGYVIKIPAGNGAPVQLGSALGPLNGVAVDANDNVYVAAYYANAVYKIPAVNGTPVAIGSGFNGPTGVAVDAQGNVYVADFNNNAIKEIPAGGGATFAIGSGFKIPNGVAVDAAGNVYVADSGNGAVKKIPAGGGSPVVLGTGIVDPYGVAVDAAGNVFVADRNIDATEEILAGGSTTVTIGAGFNTPYGIAVDGAGNVYVADSQNNAVKEIKPVGGYYLSAVLPKGLSFSNATGVISGTPTVESPATNYTITAYNSGGSAAASVNIKINALTISYSSPHTYLAGTAITALSPTSSGVAAAAYSGSSTIVGSGFTNPTGVAVDITGNVYVADAGNNAVKKIPAGGGAPIVLGSGFSHPEGVAVDGAGNVYVADYFNNAVKEIPAGGGPPVTLGSGFASPIAVAVDAAGNVYVADYGHNAVKIIPQGIGVPVIIGSGFSSPTGIALDAAGNVYVADYGNSAVKEIPAAGGSPVIVDSGLNAPFGIAVDASDNVFVSDYFNSLVIEIPVGGGSPVNIGSGFSGPTGLAADGAGNVYVADYSDNAIRKITPVGGYYIGPFLPAGLSFSNATGKVSGTPAVGSPATNYTVTAYNSVGNNSATVNIKVNALTLSYTSPHIYTAGIAITALAPVSSGVAAAAYSSNTAYFGSGYNGPTGVAADINGNIYIADPLNNAVRKFPAGGGAPVAVGSGFSGPFGVAVDAAGNVYVADQNNNQIKEVPVGGGAPVILASSFPFDQPSGVAVDALGNVYVADYSADQVEKIPVGGGSVIIIGTGYNLPVGVALDAAGNLYVADKGDNAVYMLPAGGGPQVTLGSGFSGPYGVAVDRGGNVFVADNFNSAVKEIPLTGGAYGSPISIGSGFGNPEGLAVDGAGNVYVADFTNKAVMEIKPVGGYHISLNLPVGLTFDDNTGIISGKPSANSPAANYTVTAYNNTGSNTSAINITVNLPPLPTISYSSPQSYEIGVTISALSPTSTRVAPIAYGSVPAVFYSGFAGPTGVAVDTSGNVYVADPLGNAVYKISAGNTIVPIGSGFNGPFGLAVDAAGNVYVADQGSSKIKKIPVGGGAPIVLGSGFNAPTGVAVDAAGNIYVADYENNAVKKIPAGSNTPVTIGSTFSLPVGVAVDAAGNVYVADRGDNNVYMIPVGGGAQVTLGSGFLSPYGVAVDATGNVYVADNFNNAVKEIPVGSSTPITLGSGFVNPEGLALDGAGNVYVADFNKKVVDKIKPVGGYYINQTLPAGLIFNNTTGVIHGKPTVVSPAKNYKITGYDLAGGTQAALNLKVISTDPTLSALKVITGVLSPAFASGTASYTSTVSEATDAISVEATTSFTGATMLLNGLVFQDNTVSDPITLTPGQNIISLVVTAEDGVTTKTYTITVMRGDPTNDNLSALKLVTGTLSPVFAPGTTSYTSTVSNATDAISVEATTSFADATMLLNGLVFQDNTVSDPINLSPGKNVITLKVTAQDGTTTKTYTITVTRTESANANLKSLKLSKGTLTPAFNGSTTSYTESVDNTVTSLTVTPATSDLNATVSVNGVAVASGSASGLIALAEGANTVIGIVVKAQNGVTTKTYTVTIARAPSANASLSSLGQSVGGLTPAFSSGTTGYTISAGNATASITLKPVSSDANATIKVNGTAVTSGTMTGPIALSVGPNIITAAVTAQDGVTTKTYTLTVTRAPSANATLSNIKLSTGTLSPAFASGTINYSASVANAVSTITIAPATTDANATIKVNGTTVASGTATNPIALTEGGQTVINTVVTAQNGTTTKTYKVTVTRAPSSNATLSKLGPSIGGLTPAFSSTITSYTISTGNATASLKLTPVSGDANATIKVNGTAVASGTTTAPLTLAVGPNTITTAVTAQDGATTKTYTLTVTRAASGADSYGPGISVTIPIAIGTTETPQLADDGIQVHQGVSPNGDGINDFLQIDNINQYPDNKLMIMNRNGQLVYETQGYDNNSKVFDGHSNKNGQMQLPGTYFYQLDYTVSGVAKHKTGFIVLKY